MRRIKALALFFGGSALLAVTGSLRAGPIDFGNDPASLSATGTFADDNDEQYFNFSIDEPGLLTVRTTSFATGGFAPDLTLFDAGTGDYITQDDGETVGVNCGTRVVVAGEGCLDALIDQTLLDPGNYTLILTESGNAALGGLTDGFYFDPNNNPCAPDQDFTNSGCLGYGSAPGAFYLPDGTQQTGNWAVSGSFTAAAPEPASFILLFFGLGTGILWKRRERTQNEYKQRRRAKASLCPSVGAVRGSHRNGGRGSRRGRHLCQ